MLSLKNWKINKLQKKLKAMRASRHLTQPKDEVLKKEVMLYFELAALYKGLIGHRKHPYAKQLMEECYRAAAQLDDATASYNLGKLVLEQARFHETLQAQGVFDSPVNERHMQQAYEEAHAYLKMGDELGSIQAKRLRGLCLVNGWGIAADQDKGFELIVSSIEKEGSWDKVPQIFAAMGLNKPEFFAQIMQRKK